MATQRTETRRDIAWRTQRLAKVNADHAYWLDVLAKRYDVQAALRAQVAACRAERERLFPAARADLLADRHMSPATLAHSQAWYALERAKTDLAAIDVLVFQAVDALRLTASERDYHEGALGREKTSLR